MAATRTGLRGGRKAESPKGRKAEARPLPHQEVGKGGGETILEAGMGVADAFGTEGLDVLPAAMGHGLVGIGVRLSRQEAKDVEGYAQATFANGSDIVGLSCDQELCLKGFEHFEGIVSTDGEAVERAAVLLEIEVHGDINPYHALDARIDLRHQVEVLIDTIDQGETQPFEKGTPKELAGRGVGRALLIEHGEHRFGGGQHAGRIGFGKGLREACRVVGAALRGRNKLIGRLDDVGVLLFERGEEHFEIAMMDDIVAVDEGNVFAPCLLQGPVASGRRTSVRLMQHRDTCIAAGIVVANVPAPIGRAIIDDDNLDVAMGLR